MRNDEPLVREVFSDLEGLFDEVDFGDFSAPGVFACGNCGASSWTIGCDDDDWHCNMCGMLDATFACVLANSPTTPRIDVEGEMDENKGSAGDCEDGSEVQDMELSGYVCGHPGKYDRFTYQQTKLRRWLSKKSGIDEGARNLILAKLEQAFSLLNENFDEIAQIVDPGKKKSFPNYQLALYNVLELLDRLDLATDLTLAENRQTRKQFAVYWWYFCKRLGWPFLSKDIDLLKRCSKIKD